ncbi:MAG: ParB N-terminal domain-containing protein, partial [Oscillospiraceae bacterium]|nr:ParB N-terminal domain-containing protein [Oscillospiraceae bacterium]
MQIRIFQIKVNPGRREADLEAVQKLADSISKVGLMNPITVDRDYTLIAGLHRLEAAKVLGWTEIECTVSNLEGLQVELAEIDENFVRKDLSHDEFRDLLLRRKEIYESLHPETKHGGDRKSEKIKCAKCTLDSAPSFIEDTAEKLNVHPTTVRREIQTAKNLTPEAKEIIKGNKVSKMDALKLSRLAPE